jgi:8-amino-7-oxononanoate synthase
MCPGNKDVLALEKSLLSSGLLVKAIRHPTVAKGSERIRICLHAFNEPKEIDLLTKTLNHAH